MIDIHLFKDIKRSDDSHYWFSDKLENNTIVANSASTFEDALITIGRAMITHNMKVNRILYNGEQVNQDDWSTI